jgi:hypothetical protein
MAGALVSCGLVQGVEQHRESAYRAEYDAWTRHGRVSSGLAVVLEVQATLLSPSFRMALADKKRTWRRPDEERALKELSETFQDEWRKRIEFVVFVFTPDPSGADMTAESPVWKLHLESPAGVRVEPDRIERISEPYEELVADYPSATRWSVPYRVWFGRPEAEKARTRPFAEKPIWLVFSGPAGEVRMTWGGAAEGGSGKSVYPDISSAFSSSSGGTVRFNAVNACWLITIRSAWNSEMGTSRGRDPVSTRRANPPVVLPHS